MCHNANIHVNVVSTIVVLTPAIVVLTPAIVVLMPTKFELAINHVSINISIEVTKLSNLVETLIMAVACV